MRRNTEELSKMILAKPTEEIKISEIETLLKKNDLYSKCSAVQAIARKGGRDAYSRLIDIVREEKEQDLINAAIIAMAQTKTCAETYDSRFLFPLVNLYNHGNRQIKACTLMAINRIKDPRAIDFIEHIQTTEQDQNLRELAGKYNPAPKFAYTFAGTEDELQNARNTNCLRIRLKEPEDLHPLVLYFEKPGLVRKTEEDYGPLTYIVDEKRNLFIGGFIESEEHVSAARGENVLAAGEITAGIEGGKWIVKEINNRSIGYHPARSTFDIVGAILDHIGLQNPGKFTYLHPREGFFSDDFLSLFPFHPEYEKKHFGKKKTTK